MSESHRSLFAKLVEPHFDGLYRAAMRLTRNADDAEDLVQEACLRAYAQLSSLERAERPAAWLQRVQYRIFIDDVRHRRRSPFAALSEPGNLLDITPSQQPRSSQTARCSSGISSTHGGSSARSSAHCSRCTPRATASRTSS